MKEIFKKIKDFPNYSISNKGRIKSCGGKFRTKRFLSPYKNEKGYLMVLLYNSEGRTRKRVHQLVLEHFIEQEKPENYFCNHKDGDKQNNSIDNLEWVSCYENNHHAWEKGLTKKNAPLIYRKEFKR